MDAAASVAGRGAVVAFDLLAGQLVVASLQPVDAGLSVVGELIEVAFVEHGLVFERHPRVGTDEMIRVVRGLYNGSTSIEPHLVMGEATLDSALKGLTAALAYLHSRGMKASFERSLF